MQSNSTPVDPVKSYFNLIHKSDQSLQRKLPTVQDVALKAGVSTATVSRALSNPASVSESKRKAVNQAILATGYRVNRAARNLRTQKSNTVLALLPDIGNTFFSQVLQGIEGVLTPEGLSLIVAETQQMRIAGDNMMNYLEDQRADGIIILDGALPDEVKNSLPEAKDENRIVFACEWIEGSSYPSVRNSNYLGAIDAVNYLHTLGHRQLAHIKGPNENVLTDNRLVGFNTACERLNIEPYILDGEFTLNAGAVAAEELLQLNPKPTAVFCASDTIAMGLIAALNKKGISIPEDMSVFGFDDIELCEYFIPTISTIRQNRTALGSKAAKLLLECLQDGPQPDKIVHVPIELIARDSCAELNELTN